MTAVPLVLGPRDTPALRRHLLDLWRPDGSLAVAAEARRFVNRDIDGKRPVTRPEFAWHRDALGHASLWWVDGTMCDLLRVAERKLDGGTLLEPQLIPAAYGLVVFETSMEGLDVEGGKPIWIDAILWGPVNVITDTGQELRALGIGSYRRLNYDDGLTSDEIGLAIATGALDIDAIAQGSPLGSRAMHGDLWVPLGRSDWVIGTAIDAHHEGMVGETAAASMIEDRQRLATLWLLATQPGIADVREDHGSRAEQRRDKRAGHKPSPVRIVTLPKRARSHGPSVPTGRKITVRTLVGAAEGGFWRNQPYGPGRAYRRPKWISAFWRGPVDGPVSIAETVRVLRNPEDPQGAPPGA